MAVGVVAGVWLWVSRLSVLAGWSVGWLGGLVLAVLVLWVLLVSVVAVWQRVVVVSVAVVAGCSCWLWLAEALRLLAVVCVVVAMVGVMTVVGVVDATVVVVSWWSLVVCVAVVGFMRAWCVACACLSGVLAVSVVVGVFL